jgi:hypothetical protein
MTKRVLESCGAIMLILGTVTTSAYGADRGVTGISVAGQAIGGSLQYATATISIFCPGTEASVTVYAVNNVRRPGWL